jgi:Lsr2
VAQRVVVQLTDDIDGKPAAETVSFGLDGRSFEIDLSERNARALRKDLAPWVASARRVSGRRSRGTARGGNGAGGGVDPKAVRAWAASNGIEVSPRGRISSEVLDKYRAAGN